MSKSSSDNDVKRAPNSASTISTSYPRSSHTDFATSDGYVVLFYGVPTILSVSLSLFSFDSLLLEHEVTIKSENNIIKMKIYDFLNHNPSFSIYLAKFIN